MIAAFAPVRPAGALIATCTVWARIARARQVVCETPQDSTLGTGPIAERLSRRLDTLVSEMAPAWPLLKAIQDGVSTERQTTELEALVASCRPALAALERALLKLPGTMPPAEVAEILQLVCEPSTLSPVVLVSEDVERDEDGFIPLPIWLVAAPLSWPRLAGLVLGDDRRAAGLLGPAYLLSQVERLAAGTGPEGLAERISIVAAEIDQTCGLPADARAYVEAMQADRDPSASPVSRTPSAAQPPGSHPDAPRRASWGQEATEFAAGRLQGGVLASAWPTRDRSAIRADRDRLCAQERTTPDQVYEVLEGLREVPLSAAEILNGGWLAAERLRPVWLAQALSAAHPEAVYGNRVLALDALILKSLEIAGVHRLMVGK